MNETSFWSQGWWQPIGIVIGAIVAYIIYRLQTKKKKLSYKVLFAGPLINVDKEVENELKIFYKGHEIKQINVFQFQIINNGNTSIRKEDFDGPIILNLTNCRTIFDTKTIDAYPENLKLAYTIQGSDQLIIEPLLLNVDDFFEIRITFDGEDTDFNMAARIEGVSELTVLKEVKYSNVKALMPVFIFLFTVSVLSLISLIPTTELSSSTITGLCVFGLMIFAIMYARAGETRY